MPLILQGRFVGLEPKPHVPAKENRREQEAHIVVDLYAGSKELLSFKAGLDKAKLFEGMEGEVFNVPVEGYPYVMNGQAFVSYKMTEGGEPARVQVSK
jgi:hypothetical protein